MFRRILTSTQPLPLFLLALVLVGCSVPEKPSQPATPVEIKPTVDQSQQLIDPNKVLEIQVRNAQDDEDWTSFIDLSHQLWSQTDDQNQLAIEYHLWKTLQKLSPDEQEELRKNGSTDAQDWMALVDATNVHPIWQKTELDNLATFNQEAIFNTHLNAEIQKRLQHPIKPAKVAVMLPLSGPYKKISHQIRNGIIRNQMKNAPETQLSFYDSSDVDQVVKIYHQAKQNGADIILGPLQKSAIDQLQDISDPSLIVLNDSQQLSHFNFRSASEDWQMTQHFCDQGYKSIAVLTSTSKSDTQLAQQLSSHWKSIHNGLLTLKTYPQKNPNLREALGSVINEKTSKDRMANIQWLLKQKLSFQPRVRKDLDAVVILGNRRQIAVFRPQLEFFDLTTPLYTSSKITPSNLMDSKPNKDLKTVIFPSFKAALYPSDLTSKFEAFGWDSFIIATHQHQIADGLCYNKGQTGKLTKVDTEYDSIYPWARFNQNGIATPLH